MYQSIKKISKTNKITIEQLYNEIGSNYQDILLRMSSQKIVIKFVKKFIEDNTFNELTVGISKGDLEQTYRSVHTLKGICLNLSFDVLANYCSMLTEYLRTINKLDDNVYMMYENIKEEYQKVFIKIKELN